MGVLTAEFLPVSRGVQTGDFFSCSAALILICYDYLLTLDMEISEIWSHLHDLTFSSILFLLVRYGSIMSIFSQFLLFDSDPKSVHFTKIILGFVSHHVSWMSISAVFALRVYALSGKNKPLLAFLASLASVRLLLNVVASFLDICNHNLGAALVLPVENDLAHPDSDALLCIFKWGLSSYVLSVTFDLSVFILTVAFSIREAREAKMAGMKCSLMSLLLRDGTIYFGCIILLMVSTLVYSVSTSKFSDYIQWFSICLGLIRVSETMGCQFKLKIGPSVIPISMTAGRVPLMLQHPLCAILVNHIILNLKRWSRRTDMVVSPSCEHQGWISNSLHEISSLRFRFSRVDIQNV